MEFQEKEYQILDLISNPLDLRNLEINQLSRLCKELRKFLINSVSISGGHFASGLGVIELTIALHYVYNTPFDKIIWDTGHQSYPHKIITNRKNKILTIRKFKGLHAFPNKNESNYDTVSVGHSSTSISIGLGIAISAFYENLDRKVACIIGDGALTAGMAFEAINHAGYIKPPMLLIINDNNMSISKNVGALNNYLNKIKSCFIFKKQSNLFQKNRKVFLNSENFFENLGFNYTGPVDGHDVNNLVSILFKLRQKKEPQVLHIITKKGKGYKPAEYDPIYWHAVTKFNPSLGEIPKKKSKILQYSEVFGRWLCNTAKTDKKLVAITPAMCEGSGMTEFAKKYPNQYFDVAIAEQHAISFAAGLSIGGYNPIVAIYSTFLQRAYDQIIHDIAIQKLPVLFAIDRGGIVGNDGETHQGSFDLSYLRCIPNIIIMTPSNEKECWTMLNTGYSYKNGPSVVRYPKGYGIGIKCEEKKFNKIPIGKGVIHRIGKKIAILNFGTLLNQIKCIADDLNTTLVDMRFVKPLDTPLLINLSKDHKFFITIEENAIIGGAGSGVNEFIMNNRITTISVLNIGFPDIFISHGNKDEIMSYLGLDSVGIKNKIIKWMNKEKFLIIKKTNN